MASHKFRFPIGRVWGPSIAGTYASVVGSIQKRIREAAEGENRLIEGKPVCPLHGYFVIILYPTHDSDLGLEDRRGKVRLLFSYPNLYFLAFEVNGVWYPFSDMDVSQYTQNPQVHLPFKCGYHNGGMGTNFNTLLLGHVSVIDVYRSLSRHPHNLGGNLSLRVVLGKCSVLFPEAMRFPGLKKLIVGVMRGLDNVPVTDFSIYFNHWRLYCDAIRAGRDAFQPLSNPEIETFDDLLSIVGILLSMD